MSGYRTELVLLLFMLLGAFALLVAVLRRGQKRLPGAARRRGRERIATVDLAPSGVLSGDVLRSMESGRSGRLFKYRVDRVLNRGGYGTIYKIRDLAMNREACLKLPRLERIREQLHKQDGFGAFVAECKMRSRLQGDYHIRIFDTDHLPVHLDGRQMPVPYYTMEFVAGYNLAELLRMRRLVSLREAVTIMLGVLQALKEAHLQGIVHRDIKLANILVGYEQGRRRFAWRRRRMTAVKLTAIKLIDFGLAGAGGAGAPVVSGTPGYIAPEVFKREGIGPPADIFALGVVFSEILVGRQLLPSQSTGQTVEILLGPKEIPLPAELPDPIRRLIAGMIAKDPWQRPTASDVIVNLRNFVYANAWDIERRKRRA